ncbi:MAG: sugar transferase [Halorientalis sp.]
MVSGRRYRIASVGGTVIITAGAVVIADHRLIQELLTMLPLLARLPVTPPQSYGELVLEAGTTLLVVLGMFVPLFKPRPRRVLDTITVVQKRVLMAIFALATIGYFDYTYRLPRVTLIGISALLLLALPAWFLAIRRHPRSGSERAIIVGDDLEPMTDVFETTDLPILGYVSSSNQSRTNAMSDFTDGGVVTEPSTFDELNFLGGLPRLEDILIEHDIDTAILAFDEADRTMFFGALDTCYENGVTTMVHRNHADSVLIDDGGHELVDVDLEPWDWQDYLVKRVFDIGFATVSLIILILIPVIPVIAVAIKLDSPGPLFYSQTRTTTFGGKITVYKFRTMLPESEDPMPIEDEVNDRITRVGQVLRRTHLDEIPQLWTVLIGKMSVVGPRAVWTDEESLLETETPEWRKRWFVKPGLTGLAQINDVASTNPDQKLHYDITYIREQSFWFDLQIILRQFWKLIVDVRDFLKSKK